MANFDPSVASNFPNLYTASQGLPMSASETNQINQISGALSKHKELTKLAPEKARKEFATLDVDAQAQLKFLFKDADYTKAEPTQLQNVGSFAKNVLAGLASPLRVAFKAAEVYNRFINEPYLVARQAAQGAELFSYKTWKRAWDGKELYDNKAMGEVVQQYGKARSYVAAKLLAGRTPGEILDSYGTLDKEIIAAVQEAFTTPETFNEVLQSAKAAQISPGRDAVRFLLDRNPQNGSMLSQAAMGKFANLAGALDTIYQIAVDPLTWATGGTSKAITRADKLREIALQGKTGVAEAFKDKGVQDLWNTVGPKLKDFSEAKGNAAKSAIRNDIFMNHEGLANYKLIDTLARNEVYDAASAQKFFEHAENVHYLLSGRVVGTSYMRSGVPVARRWRQAENNVVSWLDRKFNASPRTAAEAEATGQKVESFFKSGAELAPGKRDWSVVDTLSSEIKGFKKAAFAKLIARHPGTQRIFITDDKVMDTLPVFNSLARVILPKDMAGFMTESFKNASQQDRVLILRNMYGAIMHDVGLHGVPGGEDLVNAILQDKFAAQHGWGATTKIEVAPQHLDAIDPQTLSYTGAIKGEKGGFYITADGTIHPFQAAEAIGSLPWDKIQQTMASNVQGGVSNRFNVLRTIGGLTQHSALKKFTDGWSFFTLYPRLGVRSAIDEAMMYMWTAPGKDVLDYARRQGHRMGKPVQAYTASKASIGPFKSALYKLTKSSPTEAISPAKRAQLTEEELIGLSARENVAQFAAELYNGYPEEARKYIISALIHSPDHINGMAMSLMARTGLSGAVDREALNHIISDSSLTAIMKELDLESGKTFKAWDPEELANINNRFPALAHFQTFFYRFARNRVQLQASKGHSTFDPAIAYIKNGAGKTTQAFEKAKDDLLEQAGIVKDAAGAGLYNIKDPVLLKSFLDLSSNTGIMREMGLDDIQIARSQIDMMLTDLHKTFHGSPDAFNQALYDHLHQVTEKGEFVPYSKAINKLSFNEFEKLTKGYTPTDKIISSIDFKNESSTWEEVLSKGAAKGMDQMDRQVNGIIRQPAIMITYTRLRQQYAKWEAQMVEDGVKQGFSREAAVNFADKHFTEIATAEAADRVLKYADNPDIRSQFSFSLRTLGRFYRATEDFNRRMYRLSHDAPLETLYRMRLAHLGLSASGSVYTDQQGNQYVMMPMDNVIYKATDTTMRVLGAPFGRGNVGYSQPMFNDFTLKLTMANPSFDPNAAQPTLSGPVAALGILSTKAMLGIVGGTTGKQLGENLDNWALGQVGDNMTWTRAVVPSTLSRIWQILDPSEKTRQVVTAAQQAMAYNAAHGRYLAPNATDEEKAKYLKNLRISAHNILAMRSMLGLISPVSPSIQESVDVPNYLKKVKMTGLVPEFRSILDSMMKKAANEGLSDPYELALFTFVGKYPNRLVYTVSRNEKAQKVIVSSAKDVKDWGIGNSDMIKTYGEAAFIFAPKIGKFDQGTYQWMQASGMITSKSLETYFSNIQTAVDKQRYYDIGKEETIALETVLDSGVRADIIENAKNERAALKTANPLLEAQLAPKGNQVAVEEAMFKSLKNLVTNPSTNIDPGIRTKMRLAVQKVDEYMMFVKDPALKDFGNASDLKYERKQQLMKFLDELSVGDLTMKEARRAVFDHIINYYSRNSYSVGMKGF